ncbi:hypothetical protein ASPFODRAFT_42033 [Aspergillus luchuensis CBS 106.47]|uniref:Uncharacterized protein n=1 Tax=Aspergillus luchuensis (strain CBS 106.47) TaxID=1137211 RepID=A0A1M3TQ47_ASPLC|nr:hypothetical protein ASPFODRAFT_42033 [Aspergillus luchuensis CBS 106.47]
MVFLNPPWTASAISLTFFPLLLPASGTICQTYQGYQPAYSENPSAGRNLLKVAY